MRHHSKSLTKKPEVGGCCLGRRQLGLGPGHPNAQGLGLATQHPKVKLNRLEDGHLPPCHPTAMWRGGHDGDRSTLPDSRPAAAGDLLLSPCLQLRPVLISGGVWRALINHWSCLCVTGQSTLWAVLCGGHSQPGLSAGASSRPLEGAPNPCCASAERGWSLKVGYTTQIPSPMVHRMALNGSWWWSPARGQQ